METKSKKPGVPYKKLIFEAIQKLDNSNGSSIPAIEKYIKTQHPKLELKHTTLRGILKKMLTKGDIVPHFRHKNSYRIPSNVMKKVKQKEEKEKLKKKAKKDKQKEKAKKEKEKAKKEMKKKEKEQGKAERGATTQETTETKVKDNTAEKVKKTEKSRTTRGRKPATPKKAKASPKKTSKK